jgi:hypothetical protein
VIHARKTMRSAGPVELRRCRDANPSPRRGFPSARSRAPGRLGLRAAARPTTGQPCEPAP